MVGATSGIGKALSEKFFHEGFKVTLVGRRQDRLDAMVKEHGEDKASASAFDLGNLEGIPNFVKSSVLISLTSAVSMLTCH